MTTVLGIDEAGRGPVIGPMVMAGVMIKDGDEAKLKNMGVRDSKDLSPYKRDKLYEDLIDFYQHEIMVISPQEIDETLGTAGTNLNWLEADAAAKIITSMKPDVAILDCPSPNIEAYTKYIQERVPEGTKIICEHKADSNYVVVGAGSILAKVTRDRAVAKLKDKAGVDFGSGYPSDPKTRAFLKEHYKNFDFFRKSWASYKKITEGKNQSSLNSF